MGSGGRGGRSEAGVRPALALQGRPPAVLLAWIALHLRVPFSDAHREAAVKTIRVGDSRGGGGGGDGAPIPIPTPIPTPIPVPPLEHRRALHPAEPGDPHARSGDAAFAPARAQEPRGDRRHVLLAAARHPALPHVLLAPRRRPAQCSVLRVTDRANVE